MLDAGVSESDHRVPPVLGPGAAPALCYPGFLYLVCLRVFPTRAKPHGHLIKSVTFLVERDIVPLTSIVFPVVGGCMWYTYM